MSSQNQGAKNTAASNQTQTVVFETHAVANNQLLAIATLNEEKTLNSLSLEMVELLYSQLQRWEADDRVVAVFLQSAGEKAFCAGGDVQKLRQSSIENPGGPCEYAESFFAKEYRLDYYLHEYSKPTICWGHGIVMGGGLGLLAGCKHRVVTEKTRMGMPEITIALFPDVGGSWFLNRAPGRTGLYVALTAASMNASDCLFVDYADHFITNDHKETVLEQLAALEWSSDNAANSAAIKILLAEIATQFSDQKPAPNIEPNFETIQHLTNFDNLTDIVHAIKNYQSEDKWMMKGSAALAHGSAISACNIYNALAKARSMSLKEVFQFELVLATNIVRHPEFAEGVRALLIDKDQQPKWQYDSVADVPHELQQKMITAPWSENPLADL